MIYSNSAEFHTTTSSHLSSLTRILHTPWFGFTLLPFSSCSFLSPDLIPNPLSPVALSLALATPLWWSCAHRISHYFIVFPSSFSPETKPCHHRRLSKALLQHSAVCDWPCGLVVRLAMAWWGSVGSRLTLVELVP